MTWEVIATRTAEGAWHPASAASVTIDQARTLYDAGLIEMAQRRIPDGSVELLVHQRRIRATRPPWFAPSAAPTAGRAG